MTDREEARSRKGGFEATLKSCLSKIGLSRSAHVRWTGDFRVMLPD